MDGVHLVSHIPLWTPARPDGDPHTAVQARRGRLETRLLRPLGVTTVIHGHDHRFHPVAATLPKRGTPIQRMGVPTLSTRLRGHPAGYSPAGSS